MSLSHVQCAPVLSRRHVIANTTDSTCVITHATRLWPGQQNLSSLGQSKSHDFYCWKLHTAIWRSLKEQSRFPASRRDLNYVSMCGQYAGPTSAGGLKRSASGAEAGLAIVWLLFSPPLTDKGGSHRIWLPTPLNIPSDTGEETSAMRQHLIAIYGQLLWFQSAAEKKKAKTLSTYNYGDQTLQPFSAAMG